MHFTALPQTQLTQINFGLPPPSILRRTFDGIPPSMLKHALRQTLIGLVLITPALAATTAEQRGKSFARANCGRCHAIDRVSKSPLRIAPPLRTLHQRYPINALEEALAEGISTGHPDMPAFELNPDQIHDLLSYLKTLE